IQNSFLWPDLHARDTGDFNSRRIKQIVRVNKLHDCDFAVGNELFGRDPSPFAVDPVPIYWRTRRAGLAEMAARNLNCPLDIELV
ncbi:MAG TPA: hypothetical protein VEE85_00465, partial [Candidatus Bathyarchaeia archaeon]|nr:hypothetical protein [Candidatus Bathyarchaeia archaeon]